MWGLVGLSSSRSGQLHLRQVRQVAGLALRVAALRLRVQEVAQGVLLWEVGWLEHTWAGASWHCLSSLHLKVETVLLNLLLRPGVEMQRGAAGVGHKAAMGEHHGWGKHR